MDTFFHENTKYLYKLCVCVCIYIYILYNTLSKTVRPFIREIISESTFQKYNFSKTIHDYLEHSNKVGGP